MASITVKIPDDIHAEFKSLCAKERTTINEKVINLLDIFLEPRSQEGKNIHLKDYPQEEKSITIKVPDNLHQELKYYCIRHNKKLKNIVKKRIIKYTVNHK